MQNKHIVPKVPSEEKIVASVIAQDAMHTVVRVEASSDCMTSEQLLHVRVCIGGGGRWKCVYVCMCVCVYMCDV